MFSNLLMASVLIIILPFVMLGLIISIAIVLGVILTMIEFIQNIIDKINK